MEEKNIVQYVVGLGRVAVSMEEMERLEGQLEKILNYVEKLKECDVSGIEPMRAALVERDVLRQDQVVPSDLCEDILKNAPSREGNYFKVPKIIE